MMQRKGIEGDASENNHEYYVHGYKAFDASEFHEAVTLFKHALDYWPEDAHAWMALGNCYDALKRHKKAEVAFRSALEFSATEDREKVLFNLGNSLFDRQRCQEAVEAYSGIEPGS